MKVLVTGATGFVGRALVDRLLKERWRVAALVRRGSNFEGLKRKGVKLFFGDVSNPDSVKGAVKGVDIIVNSAAALPYHNLPDKKYWEANVYGVKNVIQAAKISGIKRLVHISTVGIYGATSRRGASERSKTELSGVYSRTKFEGEKIVWKYIKEGFPATIIRPTIAYGPGDIRPGFLNLFVFIKKGMFVPVGKGDNFFHTIYVGNLVDALMLAATKDAAIGEDFIIGDDPCPTMKELVEVIAKVQGKRLPNFYLPRWIAFASGIFFDFINKAGLPVPLTTKRVKFITENKKFKINKAKKVLGYKPRVGLEQGVRATRDWYRERGYL